MGIIGGFGRAAPVALLLAAAAPDAARAEPGTSSSEALVLAPSSLVKTDDMSFGNLATSPVAGTAVIDPNSEVLTTAGGVTPLGGTVTAAAFTGAAGGAAVVQIREPKRAILLRREGGTETMSLGNFTVSGHRQRTLARRETFSFRIGGTLSVGANQVAGRYAGSFEVTVNYP